MHKIDENGIPDFNVRALIASANLFAGTGRQPERVDLLKRITNCATKVTSRPNSQPECETFRYQIFATDFEFTLEVLEWRDNLDRKHVTYKIYLPTNQVIDFVKEKIGLSMPITKVDFAFEMTTPEPELLYELIAPSIFLKWESRTKGGFAFKNEVKTNSNMDPKVILHVIARASALKYLNVANLGDLASVSPSHVASYISLRPFDVQGFKDSVLNNAQVRQDDEHYFQGVLNKIRETAISEGVNQTQRYLEERQIFSSFVRHPINRKFQDLIHPQNFIPPLGPSQNERPDTVGDATP